MKVSNSNKSMIPKIYQDQIGRAAAARSSAGNTQHTKKNLNGRDTLEISETAKLLKVAQEQLREGDLTRATKVADLKRQIDSNEYQVPMAELAKRLLSGGFIVM